MVLNGWFERAMKTFNIQYINYIFSCGKMYTTQN